MPSKLRKALDAVKDQTSIGLAKVSNANYADLNVAVLKATTHEEVPTDDRYVNEVLLLSCSSRTYSSYCVQALSRRIARTRNWIVVLKSLMLVLRLLQDGNPSFATDIIAAMKRRGSRILNLSNFRDDSTSSSPWDYTAFVRTFALYLHERLDCSLMGKLQGRMVTNSRWRRSPPASLESVNDMKPDAVVNQLLHWQRLLDRVVATRPTGPAKNNRLVQISLYSVVSESFALYNDISDALTLLQNSYFELPHPVCQDAFYIFNRATRQFDELAAFYQMCKSIGVGRTSEYPYVQKISETTLTNLKEFIMDISSRSSFSSPRTLNSSEQSLPASPTVTKKCQEGRMEETVGCEDQVPKNEGYGRLSAAGDNGTSCETAIVVKEQQQQQKQHSSSQEHIGWEIALLESASNMSKDINYKMANGFDAFLLDSLYDHALMYRDQHQNHYNYNPFLCSHGSESSMLMHTPSSLFSLPSSTHPPTFSVQKVSNYSNQSNYTLGPDPFAVSASVSPPPYVQMSDMAVKQKLMVQEQQLWMQYQNEIIRRHTIK
ncbi:Clathrin coat assembly protein [Nymphaea thermarum]|nr:Clathrin coat assembly protein [Nymphaea thermarum]